MLDVPFFASRHTIIQMNITAVCFQIISGFSFKIGKTTAKKMQYTVDSRLILILHMITVKKQSSIM